MHCVSVGWRKEEQEMMENGKSLSKEALKMGKKTGHYEEEKEGEKEAKCN